MEDNLSGTSPVSKKSSLLLWVALVGALSFCCCFMVLAAVIVERDHIPLVTSFFATSTATSPPTPTPSPTPSSVPGISEPLKVNGVEIQIESAKSQSSYTMLGKTWRPSKRGEIFLVVAGVALDKEADLNKWNVHVADNKGVKHIASMSITTTKGNTKAFTWLFAVPETSKTFILYLPDEQTINLISIFED